MRLISRVMLCAAFILFATTAWAQETVSDVLNFLVTNRSVRTDDFERDRAAAEAARDTITRALLVNLTSVPLGTSSGGFLYRLNPELGTVERASESFGSFFVERALTAAPGRATFGFSAYTTDFDRLDGTDLRTGGVTTVANQFRDEAVPFDSDALTLKVRSSVLSAFGSVGVTDRLEVGGAVPFVHLRIEGERRNTYFNEPPFIQATGEATASGVGDIALRAKYLVLSKTTGAVATAFEVRLPTGDVENLLGTGEPAYRIMAIASYDSGAITLNGNGGVILNGISDELNLAGSIAYAVQPRLTLAGEVLMRHVSDMQEMQLTSQPHPSIQDVDTLRVLPGESGMVLAKAIAGVKWNPTGRLVIGAHVAFPLVRHGLTSPLTPTVALEYGF